MERTARTDLEKWLSRDGREGFYEDETFSCFCDEVKPIRQTMNPLVIVPETKPELIIPRAALPNTTNTRIVFPKAQQPRTVTAPIASLENNPTFLDTIKNLDVLDIVNDNVVIRSNQTVAPAEQRRVTTTGPKTGEPVTNIIPTPDTLKGYCGTEQEIIWYQLVIACGNRWGPDMGDQWEHSRSRTIKSDQWPFLEEK